MERVSIREGRRPVIFIAPHGGNEDNTDIIAEIAAEEIKAYAVINRGWERSKTVDYYKDKANCNNIIHCHEDVIKDEFLNPIFRFKNRILKKYPGVFILIIHGVGNDLKDKLNEPNLGYIVGYGEGKPPSYTCKKEVRKTFLKYLLQQESHLTVWEDDDIGSYAGWARNNLNQLFRKWYPDARAQSLQLEIVRSLREKKGNAGVTAINLAIAAKQLVETI